MHKPIIQGSVAWQDLYDQGYVVVKKDEYMSHWPTQRWQPIETAPVGQYVLIAFNWKKNKTFFNPDEEWCIGCGTYTGRRYLEQLNLDLKDMDAKWMPLPEPPK